MAQVTGIIKQVDSDRVAVALQRKSGCGGCKRAGHCSFNWNDTSTERIIYIPVQEFGVHSAPPINGDSIQLECEDRSLLRLILTLFLPAILMLLLAGLLDFRLAETRLGQDALSTGLIQATLYFGAISIAFLFSRLVIGMMHWQAPVPSKKQKA